MSVLSESRVPSFIGIRLLRRSLRIGLYLGSLFDACQLMAPEPLENRRPLMERDDGFHVGAIEHLPSVSPHMHEPHVAEHLEVF